jgi:Zn-finger nucleic acid-binding protein
MSKYTLTNDDFQVIHARLCESFGVDVAEVFVEDLIIETIPRNTTPVSLPGELNPFYGKTHSDEFIQRQRARRTNKTYDEIFGDKSEEIRRKQSISKHGSNNHFYGKKHTNESLSKIQASVDKRDPEYYNRIGKILANRPKLTCPHCGKEVDERNAKRWHFDNCKLSN